MEPDRIALARAGVSRATPSDAFAAFYRAHVADVYRFVHRRCRDRELAEDITQDAFVAASQRAGDELSMAWMISVARNRLIDVIRRGSRGQEKLRLVHAAERDARDVDQVERLVIEAALTRLSVDHRIVLMLHLVDGHPVPAMARDLGRSVRSVESLIYRAKRELRRELGGHRG